jgi:hypothetical protein
MKLNLDGALPILLLAFHYPFLLCFVKLFITPKQKRDKATTVWPARVMKPVHSVKFLKFNPTTEGNPNPK